MIATTPRGHHAIFDARNGTSDGALVGGIVDEDEYGLAALPDLSGWAIDIGAHIGTVAIALALDHPRLKVVAVEALPDNASVLWRNVAGNRLEGRVFVETAAGAAEWEREPVSIGYGFEGEGYWNDNRFIGGLISGAPFSVAAQPLSLGAILATYDIERVALLKIDCEGCEWFFLSSPQIARVDRIVGEMHEGSHGDARRLHTLLDATHEVSLEPGNVAHFTAVRR